MRSGWMVPSLLAIVVSPAFSADPAARSAASATLSPQTAAALRRVLDVGFAAGRDKLATAETAWRQVGATARQDGRVEYAWGLALLKHRRTRDAEQQFQSAAGKTQPPYLPARQAVIWLKLARKDYTAGVNALGEFVETVADEKRLPVAAASRLQSAEWIGNVIGALGEIPLSKRTRADVDRLDAKAEKAFEEPRLSAAYHAGRKSVKLLAGDLSVEAAQTRVQAGKKLAKKQTQSRKEIASRKGEIDKSQESLKLTAEQWKDWLEEQTKLTKRTLTRATKELAILEARRTSITQSFLLASRQKTALLASMRLGSPGSERIDPLTPSPNDIALGRIQQTLNTYELQYQATSQQMNAVGQAAATALRNYRAAEKRYETATGKIAKSNAVLSKMELHLQQQERKLRQAKVKQSAAVREVKNRRASFTTYVKFDVDAEKRRLLETLKN